MATATKLAVVQTTRCGFCLTGNHEACCIGSKMEKHNHYHGGVVWACGCEDGTCATRSRIKCVNCGTKIADEVNSLTWICKDTEACHASVTARRANDPFLATIIEVRKTAMAKIENDKTKAKATAAPKTGTCQCGCAGTTKGGKFLPGHDARFVSTLVSTVEGAKFSVKAEQAAKASLKSAGASDALQAKFNKSLGLAKDRADKKVEAAKAKADAKAEKASA